MIKIKKAFKTAFCVLGAIIGAGFATGKEISVFFVRFGIKSFFGIVFSSVMFGMYVFFVLKTIKEEKIFSPYEYIERISSPFFAKISVILTYLFLFVSFSVMITGASLLIKEYIFISHFWASFFVCFICFCVLVNGKNGVVNASALLTPAMILGIILVAILSAKDRTVFLNFDNTLTSTVVYVSYNTLPLLTLFCTLSDDFKNEKEIKFMSEVLMFLILILMSCLWYVLMTDGLLYLNYDMPIVKISEKYGMCFEIFYCVVLFFAMLTTAFSSGIGILDIMNKKIKNTNNVVNTLVLCAFSLVMSYVGFSKFINFVYPLFGYLGLSIFLLIFLDILRKTKKNFKNKRKKDLFLKNGK